MGVTGLWTVVAPTARPTQLATLNRKRLAVDASIWIYQFLKAVRDKDGNALRNSHVVGFFRRICKLLYFGIQPVFVFDGGAPVLKRETIRSRARRREGRREDAARTAGKLLGLQMQRAAEEEQQQQQAHGMDEGKAAPEPEPEELPPEQEMVYVDEIGMSTKERLQNRQFKKKDQYHLPDLDVSIESMGAPDDPRIMNQAELEEYARQFHRGEDINLYDFTKIDFDSSFFLSLPATDRYNILNAARLRSRLRMGYSKEQLDDMFPDRMAFSRFQIDRVRERNELTQRLMHINGMAEDFLNQGGRIAGEKGKEYILVRNEGVEGGWALGVVSNKGKDKNDAIDLDEDEKESIEDEDEEDGEDFEDVEVEGLNRLPRKWARKRRDPDINDDVQDAVETIARKRRAVYQGREAAARKAAEKAQKEPADEGLFFSDEEKDVNDLFEDVNIEPVQGQDEEEADLRRAIALSLEEPLNGGDNALMVEGTSAQVLQNGSDQGFGKTKSGSDMSEGDLDDIQGALAAARKRKEEAKKQTKNLSASKKFDGPLPFESLNIGQSLLGKEKADQIEQDQAGGFEREEEEEPKKAAPLPTWFESKDWEKEQEVRGQKRQRKEDKDEADGLTSFEGRHHLMPTQETIDVDQYSQNRSTQPITINASDGGNSLDEDDEHSLMEVERTQASPGPSMNGLSSEPITDLEQISGEGQESTERADRAPHLELQDDPSSLETGDNVSPPSPDGGVSPEASNLSQESPRTDTDLPRNKSPPVVPDPDEDDDVFEDVDFPTAPPQSALPLNDVDAVMDVLHNQFLIPDDQQDPSVQNDVDAFAPPEQEDLLDEADEELLRQMELETEEHERFAASLNNAQRPPTFDQELKALRNQQKKDRRDADEVTQTMVQECQSLLRLFGLPYLTAPMEAEAQCAELVHLGLVDGIVTDDSDIFLFGGTRVYKNMFNAAKFVECYLASDLESEYALTRTRLIRFAHLLGSDYTTGLAGVGPVTALDILTDFDSLDTFRDWCLAVQTGQPHHFEFSTPFRRKFRRSAQKLTLPLAFPDPRVDSAYLDPVVDRDPSAFEWGVPDLPALRSFLMATIGWGPERTDEVLLPVIRDMNRREKEGTQANITRFFGGGVGVGAKEREREAGAPRRVKTSGRMEKAWGRLRGVAEREKRGDDGGEGEGVDGGEMAGTGDGEEEGESPSPVKKPRKKRRKAA